MILARNCFSYVWQSTNSTYVHTTTSPEAPYEAWGNGGSASEAVPPARACASMHSCLPPCRNRILLVGHHGDKVRALQALLCRRPLRGIGLQHLACQCKGSGSDREQWFARGVVRVEPAHTLTRCVTHTGVSRTTELAPLHPCTPLFQSRSCHPKLAPRRAAITSITYGSE